MRFGDSVRPLDKDLAELVAILSPDEDGAFVPLGSRRR